MELLLKQLDQCIQRQQHLYQILLDLFSAERSAILVSDVERLNRIVADKERVLQDIRSAEVQRRKATEQLAAGFNQDPDTMTISHLCALIEEPGATTLKRAARHLQALVEAIQMASERNRSLCLHALQFVNGSIRMISNLINPELVYHQTGKMGNDRPVGRMLSGAV
ncbi:MAG: flagellar protein FlgN [Desulfosarcina sp.]|nr:flagellar protein FlgN [Desulfobacterales bacterium]